MDGDGGHARLLQHLCQRDGVDAALVPAPAHLHRHGDGGGLHHRLRQAGGLLRVLHQGRAVPGGDHLAHGTAHVDVQQVRPAGLDGDLCGLRHAGDIAAEDLGGEGALPREGAQQLPALLVLVAQGLGADQLRIGKARPQLGTYLPEGGVGHPRHGGQGQPGVDFYSADLHGVSPFCLCLIGCIIAQTRPFSNRRRSPVREINFASAGRAGPSRPANTASFSQNGFPSEETDII